MSDPAEPIEPLAAILAEEHAPGTNRRGEQLAGALPYVLPELEPERIVVVGDVAASVLDTLRARAGAPLDVRPAGPAPTAGEADVLWYATGSPAIASTDSATDGGPRSGLAAATLVDRVDVVGAAALAITLGGPGRAIALETRRIGGTITAVAPQGGLGPVPAEPSLSARARRSVRRITGIGGADHPHATAGAAVLALTGGDPADPPAWLTGLLEVAGVDPRASTWRIDAPGGYSSQKVLVRVRARDAGQPGVIVKLTQDARYSPRLVREASALRALAALGPLDPLRVPRVLASGPVGRLEAVVESLVEGVPLPPTLGGPEGPARIERVIDGLIALGTRTRRSAPGPVVAAALDELVQRYVGIYRPDATDQNRLAALVERVASATEVPIVATHGDAGTHNLLLAPDRAIVALDWEAYEPDGLALWDLWYAMRSVILDVDRSHIPRRRLSILGDAVAGVGPRNDRLVAATARYRAALPVEADLIVPLFVMCWLHRALKEASRRQAHELDRAHFGQFVARILADLDAPGLRRLQASGDPA